MKRYFTLFSVIIMLSGLFSGLASAASGSIAMPVDSMVNFKSLGATHDSVTLSWDEIYNADYYSVEREGKEVYSGANRSFTDTGLTPDTTYTYALYALNSDSKSSPKIYSVRTGFSPSSIPDYSKYKELGVSQSDRTNKPYVLVSGTYAYETVILNVKTGAKSAPIPGSGYPVDSITEKGRFLADDLKSAYIVAMDKSSYSTYTKYTVYRVDLEQNTYKVLSTIPKVTTAGVPFVYLSPDSDIFVWIEYNNSATSLKKYVVSTDTVTTIKTEPYNAAGGNMRGGYISDSDLNTLYSKTTASKTVSKFDLTTGEETLIFSTDKSLGWSGVDKSTNTLLLVNYGSLPNTSEVFFLNLNTGSTTPYETQNGFYPWLSEDGKILTYVDRANSRAVYHKLDTGEKRSWPIANLGTYSNQITTLNNGQTLIIGNLKLAQDTSKSDKNSITSMGNLNISLTQEFSPNTLEYDGSVTSTNGKATLSFSSDVVNGTVKVNGTMLVSASDYNYEVTVGEGESKDVLVEITAENGLIKIYTFHLSREAALQPPTNFSSAGTSSNSVRLSWDSVPGATSYKLWRNGSLLHEGDELAFTDNTVTPGSTYLYEVAALDSTRVSEKSSKSVVVPNLPLGKPLNLRTVIKDEQSITIKWDQASEATGYGVYINNALVTSVSDTSYKFTNLEPNTEYSITVESVRGADKEMSGVYSDTTASLSATTSFSVTESTYNYISLQWQPIPYAIGYELKRDGTVIQTGSSTFFKDSLVEAEHTYTYSVAGIRGSHLGEFKEVTVSAPKRDVSGLIPVLPESVLLNLHVDSVTQTSARASWNPVEKAQGYTLKTPDLQIIYSGVDTSYVMQNLNINTKYTVVFQVYNDFGTSAVISTEFSTLGVAPDAVTGLKASRVYHDGAVIQWSKSPTAERYEVTRDGAVVYEGSLNSFRDNTASASSEVTYSVIAKNKFGESTPVDLTVTTPAEPVAIVITPTVVETPPVEGSITFSFKTIEGTYDYYVNRNPQWTMVDNGDGTFHVTWYNSVTGETKDLGNMTPINGSLTVSDEGLNASTNYHYDITAVTKAGSVVAETEVVVTTPADGSPVVVPGDNNGGTPGGGDNGGNTGGNNGGNTGGGDDGTTPGGGNNGGTPGGSDNGGNTPGTGGNTGGETGGNTGGGTGSAGGGSGDESGSEGNVGGGSPGSLPNESGGTGNSGPDNSSGGAGTSGSGSGTTDNGSGGSTVTTPGQSFTDTDGHWAEEYIKSLVSKGIISGRTATSFAPDAKITRAEFTTLVVKTLNLQDQKAEQAFVDVNKDSWYNQYINIAFKNKLVFGTSDTEFAPENTVTRQEMLAILGRLVKSKDSSKELSIDEANAVIQKFADKLSISDWAVSDTSILVNNKVVSGYPDNTLRPLIEGTRAEAAKLLYSVLEYLNIK